MRRYRFLDEDGVFQTFNKVRDAFLTAKDGHEVNLIMDGLLTHDEKLKIGRRILIAELLMEGYTIENVSRTLKVGVNTVMHVSRRLEKYLECFSLIKKRSKRVVKEYEKNKFRKIGGSKQIFKKKVYTGFKRKDVKR